MSKFILIARHIHGHTFVRKLKGLYKHLWIYILNNADFAGFWYPDFEGAAFFIDEDIEEEKAKELYQNRYIVVGERWLISDFLDFNYHHGLSINNPVHKSVFKEWKVSGFEYEKYPHLFNSPLEDFEDLYWGKSGSATGRQQVRPDSKEKEKAIEEEKKMEVETETETETEEDNQLRWFIDNYPKEINKEEETKVKTQLSAAKNKGIGFETIKKWVEILGNPASDKVMPAAHWLEYKINE